MGAQMNAQLSTARKSPINSPSNTSRGRAAVHDEQRPDDEFRAGDVFAGERGPENFPAVQVLFLDRFALVFVERVEPLDQGGGFRRFSHTIGHRPGVV